MTVTNTGSVAGDVSVLGFLSKLSNADGTTSDSLLPQYVDSDCPITQLFDFQKINLWPGASQQLSFVFSALDAGCYDQTGTHVVK